MNALPGFHKLITRCREDGKKGGIGMFFKENINYKIREDWEDIMRIMNTEKKHITIMGDFNIDLKYNIGT